MRRFALLVIVVTLLTGSVAQAASYQKTDGTIVDPIFDWLNLSSHPYSGPNLEPGVAVSFANLTFANLTNANLTNANLYYAHLYYANLHGANLTNADLTNANLTNANLTGAYLTGAYLTGAYLTFANLTFANLEGAVLDDANLTNANLTFANLTNANLTDAYLTDARLANADLSYADLTSADLYHAYLPYADLYATNLTDAVGVETTIGTPSPYYYGNTVLPSGFNPVAQGWTLAPYCDFTPDAACDVADINQMFEAGDLVTGVAVAGSTDRYDLSDNDTIDAADISEWLSQAATANGHSSAYLRGDTDLDRNVDLADYSELASNFDPTGSLGPHGWNDGNSDGDNDVDLADYNVLASNFSPAGYGAAPVPEPSTAVIALLGMMLVSSFGRLSKNSCGNHARCI